MALHSEPTRDRIPPVAPSTVLPPTPIGRAAANVADPDGLRAAFTWEAAAASLDGLPGGGLNMCHEAVDRHLTGSRAGRVALRFLPRTGPAEELTWADLAAATNRYADVLDRLGVRPGERVFHLLGRVSELYVAVLGALKHGAVACTLFSAFGPEPIRQRMAIGDGVVVVTSPSAYAKKIAPIRADLPALRHVLLTGPAASVPQAPGIHSLEALLAAADPSPRAMTTTADAPALVHFTSGTTGTPKGALHVHGAVVAHAATAWAALDLHPDDLFWCTADPGWVTGTSYGIIAPLVLGVTSVVDEADLDAERWYRILAEQRVTVWYTAPTAIRMLMKAGPEALAGRDLSGVRFAASVGEPLNPEAIRWGRDVLGLVFHDGWWQTETGGIMVANLAADDVHPGSMGRPLPGVHAAVLACDDEGEVLLVDSRPTVLEGGDVQGVLALAAPWPSMFRDYLGQPERYARCFVDGWYVSGDVVRRDPQGRYWFVGRADDVIKTAGHLIGPFEVESVLMEHPDVAEAGVYGVPDPVAGALVHAAVVLRPGVSADDTTRRSILALARTRLGPAVAPREIRFADVPKTRSGKILRRLLRARELGLPEGDVSTLEGAAS